MGPYSSIVMHVVQEVNFVICGDCIPESHCVCTKRVNCETL
jgi:hypothetical protein